MSPLAADADDDPTPSEITLAAGPCTVPGEHQHEHVKAQELIGVMSPVAHYPGRREVGVSALLQVHRKAFLQYALRDHTVAKSAEEPYAAGATVNGLPLLSIGTGTDQHFETGRSSYQYIDALFASLALNYDETRPVQAQCDLWATCRVPHATPWVEWTLNPGVYSWGGLDIGLGGADIRDRIARVGVSVNNNLRRSGYRGLIVDGSGAETALSRTCRKIVPQAEHTTVSIHLYDMTADETFDWRWGALVLTAETDYESMEVEIDMLRIAQYTKPTVSPNGVLTYHVEGLVGTVTIT